MPNHAKIIKWQLLPKCHWFILLLISPKNSLCITVKSYRKLLLLLILQGMLTQLFSWAVWHSRLMIDLRLNGPQLQLGHLQVGDEIIDKQSIAIDPLVLFKLGTGINAELTLRLVSPSPAGSSSSHCTKRAYDEHSPAGYKSWLVADIPFPKTPSIKKTLCQILTCGRQR